MSNYCLIAVMKTFPKKQSGRPRGFDRDAALDTAMRLFWRHGYDGVSFQHLTTAIGVAAPSLYAAFGNKAELYREALNHYAEIRGASDLSFMDAATSLHQGVFLLLDGTAQGLLDPKGEMGCMLNTGMIGSHPDHADLVQELAQRRTAFRILLAKKLMNWVTEPQSERLSRFITAVMQGMAIQARDGYSLKDLQETVAVALDAIPTTTLPPPSR